MKAQQRHDCLCIANAIIDVLGFIILLVSYAPPKLSLELENEGREWKIVGLCFIVLLCNSLVLLYIACIHASSSFSMLTK